MTFLFILLIFKAQPSSKISFNDFHSYNINILGLLTSKGKPYDPMVAFVCNKGAMHMDPTVGWSADSHVDCLGTKQQILDYCKLMYPQLDVQNIVETTESMIIKGWCPLGTPKCSEPDTFRVQPYR